MITFLLNEGPKKINHKGVVTIGIKRPILPTTLIPKRAFSGVSSLRAGQYDQQNKAMPRLFPTSNCRLNMCTGLEWTRSGP